MHPLVVPILVLIAPVPATMTAPTGAVHEAPAPRVLPPPIIAEPAPARAPLRLPTRIAWTVAVGGRAVTIAPRKPAGDGVVVDFEIAF